jgi:hypothetical protein
LIAIAGQNSGTGQRVKINVATVSRPRSASSVNAPPCSSIKRNAGTASPARSRCDFVRAAGLTAAPASSRPVTTKRSAIEASSVTRNRKRTRSPAFSAAVTDGSATAKAIVIAGINPGIASCAMTGLPSSSMAWTMPVTAKTRSAAASGDVHK